MLEVKQVYKTFNPGTINEKTALNGLSLTLADGDFVTVIGGNGAGKSTLLNAVAGVWPVDAGTISIDGVDVTRLPEHQRAEIYRPGLSGPHDGHRRQPCRSRRTWPWLCAGAGPGPSAPASLARSGSSTGRCSRSWTWAWRTGSPPRWGSFPAASGSPDPPDGHPSEAQAPAAGRAHRRPGPQDRRQGAGHHRAHRPAGQAHHPDDHPQHAGRHRPRQPAHHDVRGPGGHRRLRRGEAKAHRGGPCWTCSARSPAPTRPTTPCSSPDTGGRATPGA